MPLWSITWPNNFIEERLPLLSELNKDAEKILPLLEELQLHRFFRIFKADLSKECPFWVRQEMCTGSGACHVCHCNKDEVPELWKTKPVEDFIDRNRYYKDDTDSWGYDLKALNQNDKSDLLKKSILREGFGQINGLPSVSDEPSLQATFVDLTLNRPSHTSYKGGHIWRLIYEENCMGNAGNPLEKPESINEKFSCAEEEAYYRIISGMQTVIAIQAARYNTPVQPFQKHLQYLEQMKKDGIIVTANDHRATYKDNIELIKSRIASNPDWIKNMYFSFSILLQAFCHIGPILQNCSCNTGHIYDDIKAKEKLQNILNTTFASCKNKISAKPLFHRKLDVALRQLQNISRIMDCLECEKCRLHGKVKILAVQLALRASNSSPGVSSVERNEIIALINTLSYYADAILILKMYHKRLSMKKMISSLFYAFVISLMVFPYLKKKRLVLNQKPASVDENDSVSTVAESIVVENNLYNNIRLTQS